MIPNGEPYISVVATMGCGCQALFKTGWDGLDHEEHDPGDLIVALEDAFNNETFMEAVIEADHVEDGNDHMTIVVTRGMKG